MCPLNEHCLLALFDQCSLQNLLHLRAVSRYWKYLIEERRFRHMKSLKLFATPEDVSLYTRVVFDCHLDQQEAFRLKMPGQGRDDELLLSGCLKIWLAPETSRFFAHLFPAIRFLVVYSKTYNLCLLTDLSYLISVWGPQLQSLALVSNSCNNNYDPLPVNPWQQVAGKLGSLESLYFFLPRTSANHQI